MLARFIDASNERDDFAKQKRQREKKLFFYTNLSLDIKNSLSFERLSILMTGVCYIVDSNLILAVNKLIYSSA